MHSPISIVSLLSGIAIGIALTLSCGNDSPGHADAAACDCSGLEPSIPGRIITADDIEVIPAGGRGALNPECPQGGVRLSGSCTVDVAGSARNVTLEQSGFEKGFGAGRDWLCLFKNNEIDPVTVRGSVICLMPTS